MYCSAIWDAFWRLVTTVLITVLNLKSFFSRDVLGKLYCKESTLTSHLIKKCSVLRTPFRPSWLAPTGLLQTVVGLFKFSWDCSFLREYIQMNDRGVVALDWLVNSGRKVLPNSAICLVLPGLTGDALSVSKLCNLAAKKGFRTVVFNKRGFGGSVLTTPKLTGWGDTYDIRQVIEYIEHKYPKSNIVTVGVGIDCGILFSYMGEFGSSSHIKACVCISPVFDIADSMVNVKSAICEKMMLLSLKRTLAQNPKPLSDSCDFQSAMNSRTLKDFVSSVYCKMHGCDSFEAFCEKNDPLREADDFAVPLLCITSLDDPVSGAEHIPYDLFNYYPHLVLLEAAKGGHCGFFEGCSLSSWAEKLSVEFIEAILEFISVKTYR